MRIGLTNRNRILPKTEPTKRKTTGAAGNETVCLYWFVEMTIRQAWRLIVGVVGITILLIGVIMIFTPGPAMVLIPTGLAVLAVEFVWARKLLRRIRIQTRRKLRQIRQIQNQTTQQTK